MERVADALGSPNLAVGPECDRVCAGGSDIQSDHNLRLMYDCFPLLAPSAIIIERKVQGHMDHLFHPLPG